MLIGPAETVRAVDPAKRAQAAGTFARAFVDDPVVVYIYVRERYRLAWLTTVFGVMAASASCPVGATPPSAALGGRMGGPGAQAGNRLVPPRADGIVLGLGSTTGAFRRGNRYLAFIDALHCELVRGPHRTPTFILVAPEVRRCGVGSVQVREVLRDADARVLPCYLEVTTDASQALLERFGFRVAFESCIAPDAPRLRAVSPPVRAA